MTVARASGNRRDAQINHCFTYAREASLRLGYSLGGMASENEPPPGLRRQLAERCRRQFGQEMNYRYQEGLIADLLHALRQFRGRLDS